MPRACTATSAFFSAARSIRRSAFVLHSAEYRRPDTLDIDGRVALTIGPDVLRDIGLGKGPDKSLVAFGYAGWAPSQLDDELAHGVWMTMPEDPGARLRRRPRQGLGRRAGAA